MLRCHCHYLLQYAAAMEPVGLCRMLLCGRDIGQKLFWSRFPTCSLRIAMVRQPPVKGAIKLAKMYGQALV